MKSHKLVDIQKRELKSMPARIAAGFHSGGIHGSGAAESMPILNQTPDFLQRKTGSNYRVGDDCSDSGDRTGDTSI